MYGDFRIVRAARRKKVSGLTRNEQQLRMTTPTNCYSLLFPTAQSQTSFAHLSLIFVREIHDFLVNVSRSGGGNNICIRRINSPILDIIFDGLIEEDRILRHHTDCLTQRILLHGFNILAIDDNCTAVHIVETE